MKLQSFAIIALLLAAIVCQDDKARSVGRPITVSPGWSGPGNGGFFPGGGFPGGFPGGIPGGFPIPGGNPGGIPPFYPGGNPGNPGGPVVSNPGGAGNFGVGDRNADFSVDLDSGVESAINTLLGKASDGSSRIQSFTQARSQPPDSDIQTAQQRTGQNFAALRASGGPGGASAGVSAARCGSGGCFPPPPCNYCYNPCYSCPTFRPRLYCSVTYYPTWRFCCWIVWWWY